MELDLGSLSLAETTDLKWRGLYITSAILLMVIAALSFLAAYGGRILYASGYPSDPAAYLELVSQNQMLAATTWSVWIVRDFLSLPALIAFYIILGRYNRSLALLDSLFVLFYAIYDVGVTELSSLILVSLSQGYAGVTTAAARASLVVAATYGYYALPLQTALIPGAL